MIATASAAWFARHELRLVWRDALTMLRGGRRGARGWFAAIPVIALAVALHGVAYSVLAPALESLRHPDKAFFVSLTGSTFLAWTLLLSQAMESVTRGFYARADLDLILASPASAQKVFAIRIGAMAVGSIAMAMLLIGPAIDVMAALAGPRFLMAYGVIMAMGCAAAATAVGGTAVLFRFAGPKRTRIMAQIIAAVVGAGFVIGIQAAAILSSGSLSRLTMFRSPAWIAAAPDLSSPVYWPARASLGDLPSLAWVLVAALTALVVAIVWVAPAFAGHAIVVAGLSRDTTISSARPSPITDRSRRQTLRWKEWMLLRRDPWLVSQTLMQVLYLLPPALLLWRNFGTRDGSLVVLVPILVMAAGQLAGGLAWLAISGEDAPDLIATAPVDPRAIVWAKIEAVLAAVALPLLPITGAMAVAAPKIAGITAIGCAIAASGACAVQLIFKAQAKRSNFRRRQTSSRLATFAEAFLSISIAAATGLTAAGLWPLALVPAAIAGVVLGLSKAVAGPAR